MAKLTDRQTDWEAYKTAHKRIRSVVKKEKADILKLKPQRVTEQEGREVVRSASKLIRNTLEPKQHTEVNSERLRKYMETNNWLGYKPEMRQLHVDDQMRAEIRLSLIMAERRRAKGSDRIVVEAL